MVIFVNSENEIKDVNTTTDTSLTGKVIDDNNNPFKDWSIAKICCYKAIVVDGKVTMMTPYVDSRLIEHIEQLGKKSDTNESDIVTTMEGLTETSESVTTNTLDIDTCLSGIAELYELINQ